ncbi:MAG: ImmA/IrrE family metallo-endopeptidase [Eubacteriaceae bacterium]|jgi:hypothetical protein|nr:ImmA/IrrE family metallo-endopeptidase [Eubacteriaceae bacterium]
MEKVFEKLEGGQLAYNPHHSIDTVLSYTPKSLDRLGEAFVTLFKPYAMIKPVPVDIRRICIEDLHLKLESYYLAHTLLYFGLFAFEDYPQMPVYIPEKNKAGFVSVQADTVVVDTHLLAHRYSNLYRFTIAHEVAHSLLHRHVTEYVSPGTEAADIVRNRLEGQANRLAAAILMPKTMVMLALQRNRRYGANRDLVGYIAGTFQVSRQAAYYRLLSLKVAKNSLWLDPPMELVY